LSNDAGGDEGQLIEEFERIRRFCLDEKHVNCFLSRGGLVQGAPPPPHARRVALG
jgi:hypothetical protein